MRCKKTYGPGSSCSNGYCTKPGRVRCVPSLYHDRNAWPKTPHVDADGDENWLAGIDGREIVYVPARAGDLIIWDSCLPHSNSKNMSLAPRIAFYVLMGRRE